VELQTNKHKMTISYYENDIQYIRIVFVISINPVFCFRRVKTVGTAIATPIKTIPKPMTIIINNFRSFLKLMQKKQA